MRLFAIYIGGEHPSARIEIHDMRFVIANTLQETHDALRAQWWGTPGTLHIDCWAEIDHADGYDIVLAFEPVAQPEKLYYVNLGGYDPARFAEQHKNMFVVARSAAAAETRALATISDWKDPHRDDLYEAEQAFALDQVEGLFIHLRARLDATSDHAQPRFSCRYTPLK